MAKKKIEVWIGSMDDGSYELAKKKNGWIDCEDGFSCDENYLVGMCRREFESATRFKLKPGTEPIKVMITIKRVKRRKKKVG